MSGRTSDRFQLRHRGLQEASARDQRVLDTAQQIGKILLRYPIAAHHQPGQRVMQQAGQCQRAYRRHAHLNHLPRWRLRIVATANMNSGNELCLNVARFEAIFSDVPESLWQWCCKTATLRDPKAA